MHYADLCTARLDSSAQKRNTVAGSMRCCTDCALSEDIYTCGLPFSKPSSCMLVAAAAPSRLMFSSKNLQEGKAILKWQHHSSCQQTWEQSDQRKMSSRRQPTLQGPALLIGRATGLEMYTQHGVLQSASRESHLMMSSCDTMQVMHPWASKMASLWTTCPFPRKMPLQHTHAAAEVPGRPCQQSQCSRAAGEPLTTKESSDPCLHCDCP